MKMSIWNTKFVGFIENALVNLTNYVWKKRREEEKKTLEKIRNKK